MTNWPQITLNTNKDYSYCFGCGQDNPIGLKLKFETDGKNVRTEFTPGEQFQGWSGYLHGGITACILDEVLSQAVHMEGLNCVTARLETKLTHLIPINQPIVATSTITKRTRKVIKTKSTIYLKDGTIAAEGIGTHFVVSQKESHIGQEKKLKTETPNNRRAVLWDLDGTIVDSEPYHKIAWREFFTKRGMDFTEDNFKFAFGRRNEEIFRKFIGPNISQQEVDIFTEEKESTFRRYIKGNIKALPGVIKLLKSLSEAEFKLAIVSSTPIENIQLITETLGIKTYFSLIISGKDVTEGKPSPQGFLLAAKKLGVQPQNCIVIEDAVAGVRAAKSGSMYCIAVTNTCPREDLAEAEIIVDSLGEITVKTIEELFNHTKK